MICGRERSSGIARGLAFAASAVLFLTAAAAFPARAGLEEEDIARVISGYRSVLDEAKKHLDELEYPEAIAAYSKLIEAHQAGKIPMLTPDARQIVARAYEGRALAHANLGKNPAATADFESLIRFDPSYTFDVKGIPPKIVALYTSIRKKTVGTLAVEGEPLGAQVSLNDQAIGLTPMTDRDWLAGTYRLRVTRPGFDPYETEIRIDPGVRISQKYRLTPNARGVLVATSPRGVKVMLDGADRGVTAGEASPEYEDVAKEIGVPKSEISAPLLLDNLSPGEHEMMLHLDCFEELTVKLSVQIDASNNAPLAYKPFLLSPSRGKVEFSSEPSGAGVVFDGKSVGRTPLALDRICSGRHDLVLEKEGLGRYAGPVDVVKDQTVKVSQRLRLSLAAFDLRPSGRAEDRLGPSLKGSQRYNVLYDGSGIPTQMVERVRLEMESAQGRGLSDLTRREVLNELKSDLLAIATPSALVREGADLLLYGRMQPMPDRVRIEPAGSEGMRRLASSLDASVPVKTSWVGMKLIDVAAGPHPIVLSVTPGGPASLAGIEAGDAVVSAASAPIGQVIDFLALVEKSRAGDSLVLTMESGGHSREVTVKLLASPKLLPGKDPDLLYNKAIADLLQANAATENAAERAYGWLNVGLALMHFSQWEMAMREALRNADLPDSRGISRGTIRYLVGLCYEKLGMEREAGAAYQEAASMTSATLVSNDGPLLAPSARRRANQLGSNR